MDIKERIQVKSTELFKKYGVRSITMDEIAGQLGISKKTIYHFYSDKDELVIDVISLLLKENRTRCATCVDGADNAIHEKLLGSLMAQEVFAAMNPILIHDLERYHPRAYAIFLEFKSTFMLNLIKENIHRGIEEGIYRQVDVEAIAILHLQSITSCLNNSEKMSMAYMEKQLTSFYLHGLANAEGLKMIEKYKELTENNKLETV